MAIVIDKNYLRTDSEIRRAPESRQRPMISNRNNAHKIAISDNVAVENFSASFVPLRDPMEAEALLAKTMQQISELSNEISTIHGNPNRSGLRLI